METSTFLATKGVTGSTVSGMAKEQNETSFLTEQGLSYFNDGKAKA